MPLSRREFLRRLGLTAGALPTASALTGCDEALQTQDRALAEYEWAGPPGPEGLFAHGVASGDPLHEAVILWTRVTPAERSERVDVYWEIAPTPAFELRTATGWQTTDASRDFTIKVDAAGLEPGRTYYYRFRAQGRTSPIGRTRTAPSGPTERLRFGVASCANYAMGYFHGYRGLATRADLDAVLHLGDYIYEYAQSGPLLRGPDEEMIDRSHQPPVELITLKDYRVRYAQYRSDPDLQEAHRQHPFIVIWDDHESANNAWSGGAGNHNPGEGSWQLRKWAARRAYMEWMPVREQPDGRLWRRFQFGDLVDLIMLDTRLWGRDKQLPQADPTETERSLLGADQERWLFDALEGSQAAWRVLGQQVVMAHLYAGERGINVDQWDGYVGSRERLFEVLARADIEDLVVLTGDIHSSWANELPPDPTAPRGYDPETGGAVGVEFVTPGITSSGLPGGIELPEFILERLLSLNPHVRYHDLSRRGFVVLDVDHERAQAAWYHLERVDVPDVDAQLGATWHTERGAAHLISDETPDDPPPTPPELAPAQDA